MDGYFSPFAVWTELPKRVLKRGWARQRTLIGRELAWRVREHGPIKGFSDVEFSVFSQFGDDRIIQRLIHRFERTLKRVHPPGVAATENNHSYSRPVLTWAVH